MMDSDILSRLPLELGDSLVLRLAAAADAARLVEFFRRMHDDGIAAQAADLTGGQRRMHELIQTFPDCRAGRHAWVVLDCLFPAFSGHLWPLS